MTLYRKSFVFALRDFVQLPASEVEYLVSDGDAIEITACDDVKLTQNYVVAFSLVTFLPGITR